MAPYSKESGPIVEDISVGQASVDEGGAYRSPASAQRADATKRSRVLEGGSMGSTAVEQGGGSTGCDSARSSTPSPQHTCGEPVSPSVEVRLARLSAMAARANTASSSRSSTSPRLDQHLRVASSIPSPRVSQGGQISNKRKSPSVTTPVFRIPLRRMLLSPRIQLPRTQIRSPESGNGSNPEVHPLGHENEGNGSSSEVHQLGHENEGNGSNPEVHPPVHENEGNDSNLVGGSHAQRSAHNIVLSNEKRRVVFDALLAKATNGEMMGHETTEVSTELSVPIRTVQRIWNKGKSCLDQGRPVDVSSARSKCGRKKIQLDVSTLRDLPQASRTTIADVAAHFGVSKAKIHSMKREGVIKRVSNTLKPYLTEKNKKDRMKWCVSMLDPLSLPHDPEFKGLFDHVIIDEKWWFITRKTERYYTAPGEVEPTRTIRNKNYIPKIQILTAVGRPRFDSEGRCIFDGKIGCWAFVTYEPAKRSSVNRPAGTIEMKPIESITKDVMRSFMIEKVLPAIRAKWPREDVDKPIYIQQDNAKPHVAPTDRLFCEAAKQDGFDIRIVCQPPNSPDLNVLDLGFFSSLQSIQHKKTAKTTEELVAIVNKAYEDYPVDQSNRIFLTLHGCMKEVMKIKGGNSYDVPHIRKGVLERQGLLPLKLKCDALLVQEVMELINE